MTDTQQGNEIVSKEGRRPSSKRSSVHRRELVKSTEHSHPHLLATGSLNRETYDGNERDSESPHFNITVVNMSPTRDSNSKCRPNTPLTSGFSKPSVRTHLETYRSDMTRFCSFRLLFLTSLIVISVIPPITAAASTSSTTATEMSFSEDNDNGICGSIEVMDSFEELKAYRHCRIVEGHLRIEVIEDDNNTMTPIALPELVQVTDYVLVFRVSSPSLVTLDDLLPRLAVIRGHKVLRGYALIVIGNTYLQQLGLTNLISILNGTAIIKNNWSLCPGQSGGPRWNVTKPSPKIENNYLLCIYDPCEKHDTCPRNVSDHHTSCTAYGNCIQDPECHEECAGGCYEPGNSSSCVACRHYLHAGTCVPTCPPDSSNSIQELGYKCIRKEQCKDGKVVETYKDKTAVCRRSDGSYSRKCQGETITSSNPALNLRGCTTIYGSLNITVAGGRNITQQLEQNLGDVRVVTGYIRIYGSNTLFSLNFFRSLQVIEGKELVHKQHALYVLENENLQQLWDWSQRNRSLTINGSLFFHYNRNLCPQLVYDLKNITGAETFLYNIEGHSQNSVNRFSDTGSPTCFEREMTASVTAGKDVGTIKVSWYHKYEGKDSRFVIGYYIYFRQTDVNVTLFGGRDTCNDAELWERYDINFVEDHPNRTHVITRLQPYTRYALYVSAYFANSGTNGTRSKIMYVKTIATNPSVVRNVKTTEEQNSSHLTLTWDKPASPNGIIKFYQVKYKKINQATGNGDVCRPNWKVSAIAEPQSSDTLEFLEYLGNTSLSENRSTTEKPSSKCCSCQKSYSFDNREDVQSALRFETDLWRELYKKVDTDDRDETRKSSNSTNITNTTTDDTSETTTVPPERNEKHTSEKQEQSSEGSGPRRIKLGPDPDGFEWHKTNDTNITLRGLLHFTRYEIMIRACQANETSTALCSNWTVHNHQTPADKTQNNISNLEIKEANPGQAEEDPESNVTKHSRESLENDNDSSSSSLSSSSSKFHLKLSWNRPKNPNGSPLAYIIKYERLDKTEPAKESKCVKVNSPEKDKYTYLLEGLERGQYRIKIKLRSNGADGEFITRKFPDETPVTTEEGYLIWLVSIGVIFILGGILVLLIKDYKRHDRRCKTNINVVVSSNPNYEDVLQQIRNKYRISKDALHIDLSRKLGGGHFGVVYEGILTVSPGSKRKVAVKAVGGSHRSEDIKRYLQEAIVMQDNNSNFVVNLVGVLEYFPPLYVVMELMEYGDLKSYLRNEAGDTITEMKMVEMAVEAADGMAYLASKKLIHRDLAARNCMLDANLTLKIGDFGLMRYLKTDYYVKQGSEPIPVRWMAPESIKYSRYSTKSDVWSYGVLLWEIVTKGLKPYEGYSDEEVFSLVMSGLRLDRPKDCPDFFYARMHQCWKSDARERPKFIHLVQLLLSRTTQEYQKNFEKLSFFHSANCCDSESTEDNDEGFIASDSLDHSLEDEGDAEHSFTASLPPSFQDDDDDQVCLTPDDQYKRSSCVSLACIIGNHSSQGIRLTPTRDTPHKLCSHRSLRQEEY